MINKNSGIDFPCFFQKIGIIPATYKECLTYEAQVNWLMNFIKNTLIPKVNENVEMVNQLIDLYENLKDYVDSYFENLDVQDEINKKLDEMADDGTLQEIITEYIKLNSIIAFNNVADLKNATNLIEGSYAETYGFYSVNDGGGAKYKIRKLVNTDVVDNGFLIALNNDLTLVAELIVENNIINVKQIGSYADNIHDDSLIIQKALNSKYDVLIPAGTYKIDNTINIVNKSFFTLYGNDSKIEYSGNSYAFNIKGLRYSELNFGSIKASNGSCVGIIGENSSQYSQYNTINFKIANCKYDCFHIENHTNCWTSEFRINNGKLEKGERGFYIKQNATGGGLSHWVFSKVGVEGVDIGFYLEDTELAEQNNHPINDFEFIDCRTGEADNVLTTVGSINRFLWITAYPLALIKFNLSEKTNLSKCISANRIIYVNNGKVSEYYTNKSDNIIFENEFIANQINIATKEGLAMVNISFRAQTEDISLTHNKIIATGLPKPKNNIFFIASSIYANGDGADHRFLISSNGELKSNSPYSNEKIPYSSSHPTYINICYPIASFD